MKRFGRDLESLEVWEETAAQYSDSIDNAYHEHRLSIIRDFIPRELYQAGKKVLDFGCGDAVLFDDFLKADCNILGVDASKEMVSAAKARLRSAGADSSLVEVGTVDSLERLGSGTLDGLLAFNVLAYLTSDEERSFYEHAHRLLRPSGHLIVTHSNELFDMYSLNGYTVEFFRRHLVSDSSADITSLLVHSDNSNSITYNVRENPLTYRYKLAKYGFTEDEQAYINVHEAPPPLLADKTYPDTRSWKEQDRWKLMFICSMFASKSRRSDQDS